MFRTSTVQYSTKFTANIAHLNIKSPESHFLEQIHETKRFHVSCGRITLSCFKIRYKWLQMTLEFYLATAVVSATKYEKPVTWTELFANKREEEYKKKG